MCIRVLGTLELVADTTGGVHAAILFSLVNEFVNDKYLERICVECGAVNSIECTYDRIAKIVRRVCTACGVDLTGNGKAQRYRYIGDKLAYGEKDAA